MKKIVLIIALLLSFVFESIGKTTEFSHFPRPINESYLYAYGMGGNSLDQISCALKLDDSNLVGMKIIQIDCFINCDEQDLNYINNAGVFITTGTNDDLPKDNYDILPHTPVNVKMGFLDGFSIPVISYKLANPILITENPIFIGYDMEVRYVEGNSLRYPVLTYMTVSEIPGSIYLRGKNNNFEWYVPTRPDNSGRSATIIITLEYDDLGNSEEKEPETDFTNSGIYLGITTFNNQLQKYPISLLTEETMGDYLQFINDLTMANNTLLYYGVGDAINSITRYSYPKDLKKAVIITFTDGLDEGSLALRPDILRDEDYAKELSDLISSSKVQELDLDAYAIGVKGKDVVDDDLFMMNLKSLSSPDNNFSLDNIDKVKEELDAICDELWRQTSQRDVVMSIPVMSHEDICRFTFDGTRENTKVDDASVWIEGTFDKINYNFSDIKYHGISSVSGRTIKANPDPENPLNVILKFDDCRDLDGNIAIIQPEDIVQWKFVKSNNSWYHNSENETAENMKINDIRTSAAIMFVLDCSSSLGNEFPTLKETAKSFIERLVNGKKVEGDNAATFKILNLEQDEDWKDSVYYNLQGLRVINPSKGLYIQRQGSKSRKIVIK